MGKKNMKYTQRRSYPLFVLNVVTFLGLRKVWNPNAHTKADRQVEKQNEAENWKDHNTDNTKAGNTRSGNKSSPRKG